MFNHTKLANRRPLSSPIADATFSSRPKTTQHQINHHHHLLQELLVPITLNIKNDNNKCRDQAVQVHEPYLAKFISQAAEELALAVHSSIVLKRSLRHKEATLCPPLSTSVSTIVKKKVTILKNRQITAPATTITITMARSRMCVALTRETRTRWNLPRKWSTLSTQTQELDAFHQRTPRHSFRASIRRPSSAVPSSCDSHLHGRQ